MRKGWNIRDQAHQSYAARHEQQEVLRKVEALTAFFMGQASQVTVAEPPTAYTPAGKVTQVDYQPDDGISTQSLKLR